MIAIPRRGALMVLLTLPLLGGCATDVCDRLVFEQTPEMSPPLVMPEGVPAVAEGGQFRVPEVHNAADVPGCQARPPMTLPPDVLETPEEAPESEAGAEEA